MAGVRVHLADPGSRPPAPVFWPVDKLIAGTGLSLVVIILGWWSRLPDAPWHVSRPPCPQLGGFSLLRSQAPQRHKLAFPSPVPVALRSLPAASEIRRVTHRCPRNGCRPVSGQISISASWGANPTVWVERSAIGYEFLS